MLTLSRFGGVTKIDNYYNSFQRLTLPVIYQVAQEYKETGTFKPAKFFSIDRVFRNETLDATHLAEFHQVEGLVADRGLTLGDLLGVIHAFFKKLGIEKLRFKPAYNPYTEPSMEIFSYHEGKYSKHIESIRSPSRNDDPFALSSCALG